MTDLRFLPELDALVAPLAGDAPGGDKAVFRTLRTTVDKLREVQDPSLYSPDDKSAPTEYKPADWPGVIRACLPALRDQAKDLNIARWVVDALPRREESERAKTRWGPGSPPPAGFAALADGLTLLRRLTSEGWEYILPPFDPDDPESRNGAFDWLGDDNTGAALPQLVRALPIAVAAGGEVTQFAWADGKPDERAAAETAARSADLDHIQAVLADLDRGREELAGLRAFLHDKLGESAPGLTGLKRALDDCHDLTRGLVQMRTGGEPEAGPTEDAPAATGGGPVAAASPAATREAAYHQLRQAAELLRRLEPHSPIPYLVLRAVDLGSKPFPEMIRSFVRDDSILAEMRRELDIPEPQPPE